MEVPEPLKFSRSSIGRNRWFWVVIEDWGCDPVAKGIACPPEDALKEAELQCGPVVQTNATLAKSHWSKQRAEARQKAVSNSDDAQPLEDVTTAGGPTCSLNKIRLGHQIHGGLTLCEVSTAIETSS
jgi:hypothetical protein